MNPDDRGLISALFIAPPEQTPASPTPKSNWVIGGLNKFLPFRKSLEFFLAIPPLLNSTIL